MQIRIALAFLLLASCAEADPEDVVPESTPTPVRSCGLALSGDVPSDAAVVVRGEFDNWVGTAATIGPGGWKLTDEAVAPGEYAYEVVVDDQIQTFRPAVPTKWYQGNEFQSVTVGRCDQPLWLASTPIRDNTSTTAVFSLARARSGAELNADSVRVEVNGEPQPFEVEDGRVLVKIEAQDGKSSIRIWGSDSDGTAPENDGLWFPMWTREQSSWTQSTMYLVFTDRFIDSDGSGLVSADGVEPIASFKGGDFQGVTQAIEDGYFDRLGVDVLWLSPIYENPSGGYAGADGALYTGYHGYWPIDPLAPESNYGTESDLHGLIAAAHARNIRIVFDIALNHVHEDHIYCRENPDWCAPTCVCGEPGCDWEGENGRPLDCQFAPYLLDLNYRNHAITERVTDDVLTLIAKFDVDGLRIDAAKHLDHVIMRRLRLAFNAMEAQGAAPFYLVGETFTGDRELIMAYVADYELHGQFDFPLFYAIRGVFAGGGSFRDLESSASQSANRYGGAYPWMSPFLGNHDVPRIATIVANNQLGKFDNTPDLMAEGGDEVTQWDIINRMSMAFAFTLTQPGVPLIYYGDEVGLAGGADPDNRRMMPQELSANRRTLLSRVQSLGQARKAISALRGPTREELWIDDTFYVYARQSDGGVAIVAMNSGEERTVGVSLPNSFGLSGTTLKTWGSSDTTEVIDGSIQISLDAWEYKILYSEFTQ